MKSKVISFLMAFFVLTSTVFCASVATKQANVYFISTGNSDSILIADGGKFALIDGADNDDESMLVNYLSNHGVKDLEYLILTHPDADHCGGLDAVVRNFSIKNVFVGNGSADSKTYTDFINACMNKNLQPSVPLADKTFTLGNGSFKFYNQKANYDDVNDDSLVSLYTIGNNKFLFMGDASKNVESTLSIGKVDVLKVGHHGSKTASSDAFIKAVAPKYAVITCGKNNKYGHPHQETLNTLSKNKVTTYRTDLNGTVVATSDGSSVTFKVSGVAAPQSSVNKTTSKTTNKVTSNTTSTKTAVTNTNNTKSSTVYVTKTGKKYHKDGCSSLSKSKIPISKDEAEKEGYTPCNKCNP